MTYGVPDSVWRAVLSATVRHDMVLARRVMLISLLWEESHQSCPGLIARTELRLGQGCFGRQPELAFRRDMQVVKAILQQVGYRLSYSRCAKQLGYYIADRPAMLPERVRAIEGAARDIDPRQMELLAHLTAGSRLALAVSLSNEVLTMATRAEMRRRPGLSRAEAQREVLHRYYHFAAT